MTKLLLSVIFLSGITLSSSTYASDDPPFPDIVKTPVPTNPIPIPYPNIEKGADKPDQKSKDDKRIDKDFDRRKELRFRKGSRKPATK